MKKLINCFRRDEDGAALVEYAVILGLLLAVTAATLVSIGTEVSDVFTRVLTFLQAL